MIWKTCREQYPSIPNAEYNGWLLENDNLIIDWMTIPPAPDTVLEFVSCNCIKSCDSNRCTCKSNGLKCTDTCKVKDCSISAPEEDYQGDNESDFCKSDDDNY